MSETTITKAGRSIQIFPGRFERCHPGRGAQADRTSVRLDQAVLASVLGFNQLSHEGRQSDFGGGLDHGLVFLPQIQAVAGGDERRHK